MAVVFIHIAESGLDSAIDRFEGMGERIENYKPIFEEMRDDLRGSWTRNFQTNGSLVGGWAPLDKEYGSWKSVNFPGAPPMIRTGELFRSLRDLRGRPNEINEKSAQFGTDLEHAKFHQYGTTKMPRREIIFEPFGFAEKWGRKTAEYVVDGNSDNGIN